MAPRAKARRGPGEDSVYLGGDGYWHAWIDRGWENGRRVRWHAKSKVKARVLRKLQAARLELGETGSIARRERRVILTVEGWCTRWLADVVKPTVRPKTFNSYRSAVTTSIIPALGHIELARLEPDDVRGMLNDIHGTGKAAKARAAHRILHAALADALRDGKVNRNVAALVRHSRTEPSREDSLSADEALAVLRTAQDRATKTGTAADVQAWALAALRLLTGARPQEVLGLEPDRVDRPAALLDLSWQLQRVPFKHGCSEAPCGRTRAGNCPDRAFDVPPGYEHRPLDGGLCLVRPKTASGRRGIPIVATLDDAIAAQLRARMARPTASVLLFARDDGTPVRDKDDIADWRALCQAAGITRDVDRYIARHTTGTLLAELGVDPTIIAAIMGHSSAAVTEAYKHTSKASHRDALDQLDARIRSAG